VRQLLLDTETTGLDPKQGHRIIELAAVEVVNRRITGRHLHYRLDPDRDIDTAATDVHGLTRDDLRGKPRFADIAAEFIDFARGAEWIIHNAPFDVAFINAELARIELQHRIADLCKVLDTLALARQMHPGQRNSLDALCKRYSVDNSHREYHGALLDARILAEVYLAMTGGQGSLTLSAESDTLRVRDRQAPTRAHSDIRVVVVHANDEEITAHERVLAILDKASASRTVWRTL